jgi:hypothetical protein
MSEVINLYAFLNKLPISFSLRDIYSRGYYYWQKFGAIS